MNNIKSMFSSRIVPPQQVGEVVVNPMNANSLNKYFKSRESVYENEEGIATNNKYVYHSPHMRDFYDLQIIFEHDDNRLLNVKTYIHFHDTSPVTVSDPEILRLIGEFNDPSSNKDQIFKNIVSNLDNNNKIPRTGGNRSRRRVQTKKKKIRKHKKKYSTKKRK